MDHWELVLIFFTIALVYSAAGFGGGSSYLAVLSLYAFDHNVLRAMALICNILVVTGSTIILHKQGFVPWKKVLTLAIVSVPMAFLGGTIHLEAEVYKMILGGTLLLAAVSMWLQRKKEALIVDDEKNVVQNGLLGGSIGFISGLVGIGGGIFLSPILYLMRWERAQVIAAASSVFILVNSIAGLLGQMTAGFPDIDRNLILLLGASVLIGGQIGSRWITLRWDGLLIKRLTAILVFYVGIRLLYQSMM